MLVGGTVNTMAWLGKPAQKEMSVCMLVTSVSHRGL